jgi:hypothetical protein
MGFIAKLSVASVVIFFATYAMASESDLRCAITDTASFAGMV